MMDVKIQITGITTQDALFVALKNRVDYVGVVFYDPSPRNVSLHHAKEFADLISPNVQKVAVVVTPSKPLIKDIQRTFQPHYFQFDDDTPPSLLAELKAKLDISIIKTIYIGDSLDTNLIESYEPYVDYYLFEAAANSMLYIDQSEHTFNWGLLRKLNTTKPWILSGGLSKFNVFDAVRMSGAKIISASSTLESSPGIKDIEMLDDFFRAVRGPRRMFI